MFYRNKTYLFYFCMGLIQSSAYATQKTALNTLERPKTMDNNIAQSNWIRFIHDTIKTTTGHFLGQHNERKDLILEWTKIDPTLLAFNEKIKSSSPLLIETFTKQELDFARKYPDSITQEHFLKNLEPLFKDGLEKVDWQLAGNKLRTIFEEFFTNTALARYSNSGDIHILVQAINKEHNDALGFIQFIITPQDQYGSIKVGMVSIDSRALNEDFVALLISSIFKLIPNVARLYLHTRITNQDFLNMYQSLEFIQFAGPLAYWQDMQYLADKSTILQNAALRMLS